MQKIIIAVVVAIIAIIGLIWWLNGSTVVTPEQTATNEQVRIIASEIIAIEAELAGLAPLTETGTFTPTDAQATKASLTAKLAKLESAYAISSTESMSEETKAGLVVSTDTMKVLFDRYQNTLVAIDVTSGGRENLLTFESITKQFIKTTNQLIDETSSIVREYKYQEVKPNQATVLYIDKLDDDTDSAQRAFERENRSAQATSTASTTTNTASTSVSGSTTLEVAI